ncbi:hypothetical protein Tco_0168553 [Tanacetum coccineum]
MMDCIYDRGMRSAKAALKSDTNVLDFEAGRKHGIMVNISAGPLTTLAAKTIGFIDMMIDYSCETGPLQKELLVGSFFINVMLKCKREQDRCLESCPNYIVSTNTIIEEDLKAGRLLSVLDFSGTENFLKSLNVLKELKWRADALDRRDAALERRLDVFDRHVYHMVVQPSEQHLGTSDTSTSRPMTDQTYNAKNVVVRQLLTPLSRDDLWRDVKDPVVKPDVIINYRY